MSADSHSTARLVAAARAGDQAAFSVLIERHYPMMLALCGRALGDQEAARDVAQEAAVTALLSIGRLRRADRFGPWLAGIGLNLCRRLLRDRDWAAFSLDALLDRQVIGEPADSGTGPADAVLAADLARRVRAAVTALPPGQRQAARAYYLSGLSQAEAAGQLGIPPGAVKTRLHKARTALRASLRDYQPERRPAMTSADESMIPVAISGVFRGTGDGTAGPPRPAYAIGLQEAGGGRQMWIGVGRAEAAALALSLARTELPRPLTYQFAAALLAGAGSALREVRITRLASNVFFAQAILENSAVIDARPSDALNLAAISEAPVFVAAEVLAAFSSAELPDWVQPGLIPYQPELPEWGPRP
jgi:RNA polymerase sigma factor (sigma-70 family)